VFQFVEQRANEHGARRAYRVAKRGTLETLIIEHKANRPRSIGRRNCICNLSCRFVPACWTVQPIV
jgi:hypothetical protein